MLMPGPWAGVHLQIIMIIQCVMMRGHSYKYDSLNTLSIYIYKKILDTQYSVGDD